MAEHFTATMEDENSDIFLVALADVAKARSVPLAVKNRHTLRQ